MRVCRSISSLRRRQPLRAPDMYFRFRVEFQWFFTELSVRPGSIFAITAHLLPWCLWACEALEFGTYVSIREISVGYMAS